MIVYGYFQIPNQIQGFQQIQGTTTWVDQCMIQRNRRKTLGGGGGAYGVMSQDIPEESRNRSVQSPDHVEHTNKAMNTRNTRVLDKVRELKSEEVEEESDVVRELIYMSVGKNECVGGF